MKYASLLAGLMIAMPVHASILEILSGRYDKEKKILNLDVVVDCNGAHNPRLVYSFSARRSDGPHYYRLDYITTNIGCPKGYSKLETIEVPVPSLRLNSTVVVNLALKVITFNTSSEAVAVRDTEPAQPVVENDSEAIR